MRVHRSVVVALERIQSIKAREQGEYMVHLTGDARIVSSRGYSVRVRSMLR